MNVICYGDSNTYGYDPRGYFGARYEAEYRWVDILAAKTGWNITNDGVNGRVIPQRAIAVPENTDFMIVMLGTNDLLQGCGMEEASARMESFLLGLKQNNVLLIGPPHMQYGEWVTRQDLIDESVQLTKAYQAVANRLGVSFADAGEWNVPLTFDGVHFSEEGHRAFAEGLYIYLSKRGKHCFNKF